MIESSVQPDGIDSFPDEIRRDVEGLAFLGHLETSCEYCGHEFTLRTLKAEEELAAVKLAKEWQDTLGQAKAYGLAHVALSLTSVDHDPDFCLPTGPSKEAWAEGRFKWVSSNWYWHVIDRLFRHYLELVNRQTIAIQRVEGLSTGNLQASTPSVDSLSEQGDSMPEPETEIMDLLDSTPSD